VPQEPCAGSSLALFSSYDDGQAYLKNVKIIPGQRNTTLAIARPLLAYFIGLPPYSANSLPAFAESVPVTYALFVATM
jgi:hypothetical protein